MSVHAPSTSAKLAPMLSILIPSRNETFLVNTICDLLQKAEGEIEIIVVLDGYWTQPVADERVRYIHRGEALGMRAALNAAVCLAKGEFLMKIDAHCMVDQGFDVKLAADCEENWVVIPRRKRLDADNWCVQDVGKPDVDYEYLSCPNDPNGRPTGVQVLCPSCRFSLHEPLAKRAKCL